MSGVETLPLWINGEEKLSISTTLLDVKDPSTQVCLFASVRILSRTGSCMTHACISLQEVLCRVPCATQDEMEAIVEVIRITETQTVFPTCQSAVGRVANAACHRGRPLSQRERNGARHLFSNVIVFSSSYMVSLSLTSESRSKSHSHRCRLAESKACPDRALRT
jgi:hypothetical protein